MSDALVDGFVSLFRGRADVIGVFGEKDEVTGKRAGGCVRQPLTRNHFVKHLTSSNPADWIGVYPCIGDKCSWGCVDLDGTDDPTVARHIQSLLGHKNITSWVERSEGGFHVWVFPEDPLVPSAVMRRALMAASLAAGFTPKEVNPKAEDVGKGPGNYVRLPFPGVLSLNPPEIRVVNAYGGAPTGARGDLYFPDFIHNANNLRAKTLDLESVAALYTPPPTASIAVGEVPPLDKALTDKLSPIAWTVYSKGPLDGSDRSGTMTRLAHLCAESGLTADEAYAILAHVDGTWGKHFLDRPNGGELLVKIVERAY